MDLSLLFCSSENSNFAKILFTLSTVPEIYKRYTKTVLALVFTVAGFISYGQYKPSFFDQDIISAGVGYGGGLGAAPIAYNLLPNYKGTIPPGFVAQYEHRFAEYFGMGVGITYTGANLEASNVPYSIANPSGTPLSSGTVDDKVSGKYFGLGARPAFHFRLKTKAIDPYVGAFFGITITSSMSTITSNTLGAFNVNDIYAGILVGAVAGVRVYFSNQFGIWLEAGYSGIPNYLGNGGLFFQIDNLR
jgi:hypothetical protein